MQMKKSILLSIAYFLILQRLIPNDNNMYINIGIFYEHQVTQLIVSLNGPYDFISDTTIAQLSTGDGLSFYVKNGSAFVKFFPSNNKVIRIFNANVISRSPNAYFIIQTNALKTKTYKFKGDLLIRFNGHYFSLVCKTRMIDYIPGVIEAEVGSGKNIEFYKVKAILTRTYAIYNYKRHYIDGFNLCDGVHCQVFKGVSENPVIIKATLETQSLVLADPSGQVAFAPFHSNCGGESAFSDEAWSFYTPYLVPVIDTYCINSPHATWKKTIKVEDLKKFLLYYFPSDSVDYAFNAIVKNNYSLFSRDRILIQNSNKIIKKSDFRNAFKLPSTFFSIEYNGDGIINISGRGFGHGVGLCQEGAMVQALKFNKTAQEILKFYFPYLFIVSFDSINTFPLVIDGLQKP